MTALALAPDRLPASAAVRVEGALLPADLLAKVAVGDRELPGAAPTDYWLSRGERVSDAASRKWNYLSSVYQTFRGVLAEQEKQGVSTEALTRREWLLILLSELGYGRLPGLRQTIRVTGREDTYPVSHQWEEHLPVHLLAWGTDLDRGIGRKRAPQSMMQELLNVSDRRYLWGLLSNGRVLRVLRDSTAVVGSAYVEFDLEAIFEGDQYSDFLLLFALLHASRFELVPKPERKRRGGAAQEDTEDGGTADGADADAGQDAGATADQGAPLDRQADPGTPRLTPADCRIEWWRDFAIETGTRARDQLRNQVERAISILGTGFIAANPDIGRALAREGKRALDELHHELLRLAYQLVFLFVAEDRGVLLDQAEGETTEQARKHYRDYFSTARLRRIATRRKGDRNTDLWRGLVRVLNALGGNGGCPELALPEMGGLYFRATEEDGTALLPGSPEPLRAADLPNMHLLDAVRLLSRVMDSRGRRSRIDYQHLGADELGSVYESLLESVPRHSAATGDFWLQNLKGNTRKTTGSYYTPTVLIEKLLDNALDPVIARFASSGTRGPDELLKINLVDPACGSGHVLVAAARRIALKYAAMKTGEAEPAPGEVRDALAKVIRHCVHGVDVNPLAAEIAKVSLWLESLRPGEPLAYLDDRIKVGNALLGTTPLLLERGLPDGAFKKLAGDDGKVVTALKADNKRERPDSKGAQHALVEPLVFTGTSVLRAEADRLAGMPGRTLQQIRDHARRHREFELLPERQQLKRVADAWCAAFLWRKHKEAPQAITSATLHALGEGRALPGGEEAERELDAIVSRNRFFHWYLEFPRVFRAERRDTPDANAATGWQGGFDCVLGNPPWERVKIQEKEWFAAQDEEIADALNSAERKKLIAERRDSEHPEDRAIYDDFQTALREAAGTTAMLRDSGIFPLTGTGDVNTYAVFAEKARMLLAPEGMSGLVLPTGIATDKTTSGFFGDLVERRQLVTVLDLENEEKLFPDVHNQYRFCLFTVCGPDLRYELVRLAFRARRPDQLDDREFTLDADGFRRINPNTRTAPVCESPDHLRVLEGIHERVPVLWRRTEGGEGQNPWGLRFQTMFHMSGDSDLFRTEEDLLDAGWTLDGTVFRNGDKRALPLYEGKFAHHYDARFATYEGATQAQINKGTLPRLSLGKHQDPTALPLPRYWVDEEHVEKRLAAEQARPETEWPHDWVLGWRDVCRASDERTVIPSVLPRTAVGHTAPLLLPVRQDLPLHALMANLSSLVLDFAARQKISGAHLTYTYLEQLPVLQPNAYAGSVRWLGGASPDSWIRPRVLELTYTSYDMEPFARHLGDAGPPFVWDEERRSLIRTELDAAFFHLYQVPRKDLDLVLDSFRAFRNRSPELFKRSREQIIEVYEGMASAAESGTAYTNPAFTPPPGEGPRHDPGTSPLTRPETPSRKAGQPSTDLPSHDGLFGVSEVGRDEQLGFWG